MFFRGHHRQRFRPPVDGGRPPLGEYFCRLRQDLLVGVAARDVRKDESLHAGGRSELGRFRRGGTRGAAARA
jgi:hypothetical protein